MPAPLATRPRVQAPAAAAQPTRAPVQAIPFTRAARMKSALAFQVSVPLTAAQVAVGPIQIPPAGYLRYIDVTVAGTAAGNAATVGFQPDAPFSAISQFTLTNSSGDSIIVPITGYMLFLLSKYGAFANDPWDPRALPSFMAVPGAPANGGSFAFTVRIPAELDPRDAFCALANLAANKSYQVGLTIAAASTIYTVPPTTLPTLSITGIMYFWSQPNQTNDAGAPQAIAPFGNGSVSQIRLQTPLPAATIQLTNVGNVVRQFIIILRNAAGQRQSADWPALMQLVLNNDIMFYKTLIQWQNDMAEAYSNAWYKGQVAMDGQGGLDTGVFVITDFMVQRGSVLADSPRDQYLPTLDSTLLQLVASPGFGTAGGANSLQILTNEIKPTSAAALYSLNVV